MHFSFFRFIIKFTFHVKIDFSIRLISPEKNPRRKEIKNDLLLFLTKALMAAITLYIQWHTKCH